MPSRALGRTISTSLRPRSFTVTSRRATTSPGDSGRDTESSTSSGTAANANVPSSAANVTRSSAPVIATSSTRAPPTGVRSSSTTRPSSDPPCRSTRFTVISPPGASCTISLAPSTNEGCRASTWMRPGVTGSAR